MPMKPDIFHVLLALDAEPAHGYGILKQIETATDGAIRLAPSLLYRKLHRLLEEGWVEELAPAAAHTDDERRRYYRLTAAGRRALAEESSRLVKLARSKRVRTLAREAGTGD